MQHVSAKLKTGLAESLKGIYPEDEAHNLFNLAIEHLTGIDVRNNKSASFTPTAVL
ncbi:hypothetical protein KRR40_32100 [Niabella defluvii]|nr:hypothetical protein KRR40_32100 [Niabella sp. I65]